MGAVKPLFDTNILIDYLKGLEPAREEIERYDAGAISIISWMEVMAGVTPERDFTSRIFLRRFQTLHLTAAVAEQTVLNRKLTRLKLPDAIILATAQAENCLLVARNTRDFAEDQPGIRIPYSLP